MDIRTATRFGRMTVPSCTEYSNSYSYNQDFLKSQRKRDFCFRGDPDDYPVLHTRYAEKTKNATSDEERFTILNTLLEGEPEKLYNRQLATTDNQKL